MTEEKKYAWVDTLTAQIKDVWNVTEFHRNDGSKGTVQRILLYHNPTLVIWTIAEVGKNMKDTSITVTNLKKKVNKDGFNELHTTKNTVIKYLETQASKEYEYEKQSISNVGEASLAGVKLQPATDVDVNISEEIFAELRMMKAVMENNYLALKKMLEEIGENIS